MSEKNLTIPVVDPDSVEVATGFQHDNLEGWIPELASEAEVFDAFEKAFDYRGDITITTRSGERIEAYVFNRQSGVTLAESFVQYFSPKSPRKLKLSYAEIARLEFTGKDRAAGKHWEDWVKAYGERKAAGEQNIALHPDALE